MGGTPRMRMWMRGRKERRRRRRGAVGGEEEEEEEEEEEHEKDDISSRGRSRTRNSWFDLVDG